MIDWKSVRMKSEPKGEDALASLKAQTWQ